MPAKQGSHLKPDTGKKPAGRQSRTVWLWLVRIIFVILAAAAVALFAAGLPVEYARLHEDLLGLDVDRNQAGEITLLVSAGSTAERTGLRSGDILVSVQGQPVLPVTSLEYVKTLFSSGEGEQVTLQVRTEGEAVRSYTLIPAAAYLRVLARMHLSLDFLVGYMLAFHILFVAGFALVGLLIFWRRSDEWLAVGVALTLVLFAIRAVPEMYLAAEPYPWTRVPIELVGMLGVALPVWLLYLFPSGRLAAPWTLWPAIVSTLWYAAFFLPKAFNPILLPPVLIFLVAMAFYGMSLWSQWFRYRYVSTHLERQQTKWVALGIAGALLISYLLVIPLSRLSFFQETATGAIWFMLLNRPLYYLGLLLVPLSLFLSITRYRLWDADVAINRAAIYTTLIGLLGILWNAGTALLDKILGDFLKARSEGLAIALSGVGVATLFVPVKNRLEKMINRRFYPDRVDFDAALVELRPDVLDGVALPDLYHALVTTVPNLLQCRHAAIFDLQAGSPHLLETHNLPAKKIFHLDAKSLKSLCRGSLLQRPDDKTFPLIVPLSVPRGKTCDVVGLLALGPRHAERGFSRDHVTDLSALGARAGTAIHIIRLDEKKERMMRKGKEK